jgi:hypothetical protein
MAQIEEIKGYPNYYVDTDGKVFCNKPSLRLGTLNGQLREIKLSTKKTGYKYANIYWGRTKAERSSLRVHRLVWVTFKGMIPEGWVINHINGDKGDNRLENLECITQSDNLIKYNQTK